MKLTCKVINTSECNFNKLIFMTYLFTSYERELSNMIEYYLVLLEVLFNNRRDIQLVNYVIALHEVPVD